MELTKRKIVLLVTYGVVGGLIIAGSLTMSGLFTDSKVHLFVQEFDWEGTHGYMIIRFEAENGIFVTGEKIHVSTLLGYPVSSATPEIYSLYFPNTLDAEDYAQLITHDTWEIEKDEGGFDIIIPYAKTFVNVGVVPPITEFDKIWTQEGVQNGELIMNSSSIVFYEDGRLTYEDEIILENMITIQPSDVKLQMQSNNVSIGLALIIIGITLLTAFFGVEKIWFLPKTEL